MSKDSEEMKGCGWLMISAAIAFCIVLAGLKWLS